ncbi:ABC transporter ATP-binding protein [Saccharothrix coeruleofusca]|uniref:Macrolide ABC transporter ATP-binding protein n=1 Tax=Saccharothrix coeruleofusca TaxID=33919 RepID=A0A918ANR8_9PSEU|nr:ABC transporter ATP-binding protein [Saccharothrix coeruleofusca]GGP66291.1 macrolide ABC transporter ATP-binding protein [Saccharothrix coeruleofusca]
MEDVGFDVHRGELVAVMGPSGSGKSTLLLVVGGLERPDAGSVTVAGAELAGLSEEALYRHRRQHIGFVFQNYNLIRTLTAVENVALPAELNGMSYRKAVSEAEEALRAVGVGDLAQRFPDQMSGGQQQRVALARALGGGRRVLLADEPTGALDSHTASGVLDVMARRVADGAAGIVVTHDPSVAARAHRTIHLRDGRIERIGVARAGTVR